MSSPTPTDDVQEDPTWRLRVEQTVRNAEVREIARALASLEPGASASSKLRLAMQFEDTVFKAATSMDDYRKRLTKRLKKVQKSYKPPEQATTFNREKALLELRQKYGEAIQYIIQNDEKACAEMKLKYGEEKSSQLRQHTQGVRIWAADLGLLPNTHINTSMSEEHAEKLTSHLERRIENIRSHVLKLADPDKFLRETLAATEGKLQGKAAKILASVTKKRFEHLQKQSIDQFALFKESMEKLQAPVPIPTRSQRNDEKAALIHLSKMRAAGTTVLAYMMIDDKNSIPRNTLVKAHDVSNESIKFVKHVMQEHRKLTKEHDVSLEDVWMKPLEWAETNDTLSESPEKKQKTHHRQVLRARVLFTAGRKTPSSILAALRRKRATLVRPPPTGEGSHLVLEFGEAFTITIFLVPLLVVIRAYEKKEHHGEENVSCAMINPLCQGLLEREDLSVYGAKGNYETMGPWVEERLRDSSAHATAVLRKCFASANKDNAGDFEIEILEATALLDFLQLVRTTYIPNWQDGDYLE